MSLEGCSYTYLSVFHGPPYDLAPEVCPSPPLSGEAPVSIHLLTLPVGLDPLTQPPQWAVPPPGFLSSGTVGSLTVRAVVSLTAVVSQ